MAFDSLISAGAISQILENQRPANPVLQIIGFKAMTPEQMAFGAQTEDLRYRLMIGDGLTAHQYCVITNQDLVDDIRCGRLEKWSLIKVTSYQTVDYGEGGAPQQSRRLIYILNLEVVKKGSEIGSKISCQPGQNMNNQAQQQQQQAPPQQNQRQPYQNQQPQVMSNNANGNNSNFNRPYEDVKPQQNFNRPQGGNSFQNNRFDQPTQPQPYSGGMQSDPIRSPRSNRGTYEHQTIGIAELTPYIGKWVVKGRVTSKSATRTYNNAKGGGKLFSFTFADKTGEIKVTAFNADCERVYSYVEPNKVYMLGRASVRNADKRYTTADFEITLNNDSILEEVVDSKEVSDVPLAKFNFVSIGQLQNIGPNQPVDLIGAITEVGELATIISRTKNKELKKRDITIVDMSRHSIKITVWDEPAETFNGVEGDVFVTKAARIGTYAGRSGSAGDCIFINPDIPEVRKVRTWYSNLLERNFKPLTTSQGDGAAGDQWRTLEQMLNAESVKVAASSGQTSGIYGKCKAMLMSVGRNPMYKCCPIEGCGKKLVDTQNGELKCDKCQQTYTNFKYRYKTDIEIVDPTTETWTTLWDDKAENLFGMKAEELERHMRSDNTDDYHKILQRPSFSTFIFTLRARLDVYNNEERVKVNVVGMMPLNSTTYARRLIEEIKMMMS